MKKLPIQIDLILVAFISLTLMGCGGTQSSRTSTGPTPNTQAQSTEQDPGSPKVLITEKPLALIYKGPGSCSADQGDTGKSGYGCSEASADAAMAAGFQYKFVGPKELPDFSKAKVWIQPGGHSNTAYYAMTSQLKKALIKFVSDGGGFVGFCAGAFLATDWFYIFPASSSLYRYTSARRDVGYGLLDINWSGNKRVVFFEGGPYLHHVSAAAEITATFASGAVAAARATYGKGRVYISGPHPEAPKVWSEEDGIMDSDGSDLDLAADMISWAAN